MSPHRGSLAECKQPLPKAALCGRLLALAAHGEHRPSARSIALFVALFLLSIVGFVPTLDPLGTFGLLRIVGGDHMACEEVEENACHDDDEEPEASGQLNRVVVNRSVRHGSLPDSSVYNNQGKGGTANSS